MTVVPHRNHFQAVQAVQEAILPRAAQLFVRLELLTAPRPVVSLHIGPDVLVLKSLEGVEKLLQGS